MPWLGDLEKVTAKALRCDLFKERHREAFVAENSMFRRSGVGKSSRADSHEWWVGGRNDGADGLGERARRSGNGCRPSTRPARPMTSAEHADGTSRSRVRAGSADLGSASTFHEPTAWDTRTRRGQRGGAAGGSGLSRLRRGGALPVPTRRAPGGAPARVGALWQQWRPPTAAPTADRLGGQPSSTMGRDETKGSDRGGV